MHDMRKLGLLVLAVVVSSILSSCADTAETKQDDSSKVSAIPWNRPQSWEGTGMLGGFGTQ
jgi:outer membrane biogenesis lipoprotein LolB